MDLREKAALGEAPEAHWYYRAKSAAMLRLLRRHPFDSVLDVGAGDGFFSRMLLRETACRDATCIDPHYSAEHEDTVMGKPIRFLHAAPFFAGNLVLMMDVLEHVADDVALLRETAQSCRPGTRILITVPAFPQLWSGHDIFLGHYRRYTLAGCRGMAAAAGLRPILLCYYFGLILPVVTATRLGRKFLGALPRSDMQAHGAVVNAMLGLICAAELPFFAHNRMAGLSVFALCEKK